MAIINFTEENKKQLEELAVKFLFSNTTFKGALNTEVSVQDLVQFTSVNTLKNLFVNLKKEIESKENQDRWSLTEKEQNLINSLTEKKDFIDLLIGYKKYQSEQSGVLAKKEALRKQLTELKESTKKPEDRIAELEAAQKELD